MKMTRGSAVLLGYVLAVVLLSAAVFALCAATGAQTSQQVPFPETIVVNTTGDGDPAPHLGQYTCNGPQVTPITGS